MDKPHLNIVLNADSPLGFYLMHLLKKSGKEVIGVLTNEHHLLPELLHPNGLYFTRDFFFSSEYVNVERDQIENIYIIFNNHSAIHSGDINYQSLLEDTYHLGKPMAIFLSARLFGGQKMSSIPISEVDQFKPDTLRGVHESWIATYTRMRAKYNKFKIRTIIHPTMISPLDYILPDRASDPEMSNIIKEYTDSYKTGIDMIVKRKDLPMIFDVVHPFDTAFQGIVLTEHGKNGVYLTSSYKYPLNLSEIIRNVAGSLLFTKDLPNLKDLPIELTNKVVHKIYPTNFDAMKINGVINYQPQVEPEFILAHVAHALVNNTSLQDFQDTVLQQLEDIMEEEE